MTSRLKNRPGLRLDLNMKPNLTFNLMKPSSSTSTTQSKQLTANWREDLARIVSKNKSLNDVSDMTDSFGCQTIEDAEEDNLKPDDFTNLRKLGEGAAGIVWKVMHNPSQRVMAKKTISVEPDPTVQRQILRELSFLRSCESPFIVSFYGAFLDDGETTIAICMEYCEGGSLEDIYLQAKRMEAVIGETILAKLAEAVCKGLSHLHSHNVIHRDIKPSNILMTRDGHFKLCDLGVSGELINSMAQTFTGTQYYMAPERIKGGTYSVRSDIWSLGLSIIEVGQNRPALPPAELPHMTVFELLDYIVHQPMPNLGEDRSPECRDFILKCLIKDPLERPGPEVMVNHPFIQKWAHLTNDITPWLKQVWGWP
ncbi:MAP kinase [Hesseltinella vesiculosa]|uniref:MAP kinase n=1 Tax=Hesseltinella vesiculosa TaxID=101127 RepID=A0A1X2G2P1_9FUNG|nr:MAP kinase [Hesseltinella vesiculosa]